VSGAVKLVSVRRVGFCIGTYRNGLVINTLVGEIGGVPGQNTI